MLGSTNGRPWRFLCLSKNRAGGPFAIMLYHCAYVIVSWECSGGVACVSILVLYVCTRELWPAVHSSFCVWLGVGLCAWVYEVFADVMYSCRWNESSGCLQICVIHSVLSVVLFVARVYCAILRLFPGEFSVQVCQ